MLKSSDQHWKKFGKEDPYYGVLAHNQYKSESINEDLKEKFFKSGEQYVKMIFATIKENIDHNFNPKSAIDFGCGVGRLVIPLAKRSTKVLGIDISPGMLEEARKNCAKRSIDNASFALSDDGLTNVKGEFDFVHSYIVLQHIPVGRGKQIIGRLLDSLNPGGVGVLHVTYFWNVPLYRKIINWSQRNIPGFYALVNVAKGRKPLTPTMQMNNYNLNGLCFELQKRGVRNMYSVFTNHSGHFGAILFFKV